MISIPQQRFCRFVIWLAINGWLTNSQPKELNSGRSGQSVGSMRWIFVSALATANQEKSRFFSSPILRTVAADYAMFMPSDGLSEPEYHSSPETMTRSPRPMKSCCRRVLNCNDELVGTQTFFCSRNKMRWLLRLVSTMPMSLCEHYRLQRERLHG